MLDIAQAALHNDVLVAAGIGFILDLPFVLPYWKPAISSSSLPAQPHVTPRSEAAVTQTVTIVPEPITLSQTQTVYDTVTKNATSISTIVKQVITKQRCLPADSTAPRVTLVEYSEACTLPTQTCAPCVPCAPLPSSKTACPIISTCPEASCAPCAPSHTTESVSRITSTSPGAWAAWFPLSLIVVVLGVIFLIFRLDLMRKKVAKAEGKAMKVSLDLEAELRHSIEAVARRDDMLKLLGVFPDGDHFVTEKSLYKKVAERKARLVYDAERILLMEAEKAAQSKQIRKLEAEKVSAKEVKSGIPTPEILQQFQLSLDDKQNEVNFWRKIALDKATDATVIALTKRCQEQEAELEQARLLPAEIDQLKQDISAASKQIEDLQKEKKDQGVADRRRWIKEKADLCEKYTKDIKALKATLKEAQQLSTSSKSVPTQRATKTRLKNGEDATANTQLLAGLGAEQNTPATETTNIRSQHVMNEKFSRVSQAFEKAEKERDHYKMALNDLKSNHATENKQVLEAFSAEKDALATNNMNIWQGEQARSE